MDNLAPRIRFKYFKKDWKNEKLADLLFETKERNYNLSFSKNDVLSVSKEFGMVNQISHLGRSYAGASVVNYHIVKIGDIVYTKSPLKNNPYGIIKFNKYTNGIVSTLYAVYRPTKLLNGQFLDYYFSLDDNVNKYLRPLVKIGAKNDMKINNSFVLSGTIVIPEYEEQIKIVSFLSAIDEKLTLLKKKKQLLEKYKKGVMQKIFNQELRFKDDNGEDFPDWEEKKLGEISERIKKKNSENNQNVLTISAQKGLINQLKYFNNSVSAKDVSGYYLLEKNDFAYNKSLPWPDTGLFKNEQGAW